MELHARASRRSILSSLGHALTPAERKLRIKRSKIRSADTESLAGHGRKVAARTEGRVALQHGDLLAHPSAHRRHRLAIKRCGINSNGAHWLIRNRDRARCDCFQCNLRSSSSMDDLEELQLLGRGGYAR